MLCHEITGQQKSPAFLHKGEIGQHDYRYFCSHIHLFLLPFYPALWVRHVSVSPFARSLSLPRPPSLVLILLPALLPFCFFFHCFLFLVFVFLLFLSCSFWFYCLVVVGIFITHFEIIWLPWWLSGKEPTKAGNVGLIPG